jgi:Flp pilus assembly secretin CpaC
VPASWRLFYKDGETWKPVDTTDRFSETKDTWNRLTFKPVTTSPLRIELKMQPDVSAGVREWKVK